MKPIEEMEEVLVEDFQADWDSYITRVENGESFVICHGDNKVVITATTPELTSLT